MRRGWVKVAGINVLVLVLGLGIAELVFGEWLGGGFGTLNIPRGRVIFDVSELYPGGGRIEYVRDRYGLRGAYPSPGCIDILTLGGSTTDQRALGEGETWQDRIRENFRASGRKVSVVNAGIDGQSTQGNIYNFERWFPLIPGLKPRYVLVYSGINDMFLHGAQTNDRLVAGSPLLKLHHVVKNNSVLYRLYKTIQGVVAARQARLTGDVVDYARATWTDRANLDGDPPDLGQRVDAYGRRLVHLVELIRAMGAQPILVTQKRGDARRRDGRLIGLPAPDGQPNGIDLARILDRFNAELLRTCSAVGAVCIDLAGELEFADGDIYDLMHTTPAGSRRIGDYLSRRLAHLPVGGACD